MLRRLPAFAILFSAVAALPCLAQDRPVIRAGRWRILEKPAAFETLVNPNCSHCVDEAKRRGSELRSGERVLAWIRGKYDGGAIPVRFFLSKYRVISDTYGVFVYDPDAGFLRGFEPSLEFSFHGWRNGVLVMKHADGTLYSALSGRAFDGPRQGDQLKPVATLETDWGAWLDRYPDTVAYHMFDKYQPVEPPSEENSDSLATRGPIDPRLPGADAVLGLAIDGAARAYPLSVLEKSNGVVSDVLAGRKVVVFWNESTRTAAAYAPDVPFGDAVRSLTITAEPSEHQADSAAAQSLETDLVDRETGSHWDVAGRAVAGPLKGQTLQWLPGVQCKWFAWAAEYPETDVYQGDDASHTSSSLPRSTTPRNPPIEGVVVAAADVTDENIADWKASGRGTAVVVLDELTDAADYRALSRRLADAGLDLYYWIEVARNPALAEAHPRWMASLGMHSDWQKRFPKMRPPIKDREVAKAFPWVPIGYEEAFNAHLERIERLLERAGEPYSGLLLNDLQGGPASCGCGNLQCRWALDYGVSATAKAMPGEDVAVKFVAHVRERAPGKEVVPVWMTECEHDDLPLRLRNGADSTGLCGSVPCATGTCPRVFAKHWTPLVDGNGPVGLFALQKELQRVGPRYSNVPWVAKAVEYIDTIPTLHGGSRLPPERLWLVVEEAGRPADEREAIRTCALSFRPAAVLSALTRIDQSYEPRVISVK